MSNATRTWVLALAVLAAACTPLKSGATKAKSEARARGDAAGLAPGSVTVSSRKLGGVDRWGDALPSFAFARAGTSRISATEFSGVAMAPDGARFVSSGYHGLVVWDGDTGKPLHEIAGHEEDSYSDVAMSNDGRFAIAVSNRHVVAFDLEAREVAWRESFSASYLTRLAVSPVTGRIAVGACARYGSGKLLVLSPTGDVEGRYNVNKDCPNQPTFSKDGKYVAAGSDDSAYVWNTRSGEQVAVIDVDDVAVRAVVFHPSGKSLYIGGYNDAISLVSLDGKRVLRSFGYLKGHVGDMELTPDGKRLVVGVGREVLLFDTQTSRILVRVENADPEGLAVAPDGSYFVVPVVNPAMVSRFQMADGKRLPPHDLGRHDAVVTSIVYSPDGARVATGDSRGNVILWSATTGEPIEKMSFERGGQTLLRAWGDRLVVASGDCQLRVVDWKGASVFAIEPAKDEGRCYSVGALDVSGDRAATLEHDRVVVWHLRRRAVEKTHAPELRGRANALVLFADGFALGAAHRLHTFADDGRALRHLPMGIGNDDKILAMAKSPDEATVAVLMRHQVDVVDRAKGTLLRSLQLRHDQGWDGDLAFSPDGDYVIAAHKDRVMAWQSRDWSLRREIDLEPHMPKGKDRLVAVTLGPSGLGAVAIDKQSLLFPLLEAP